MDESHKYSMDGAKEIKIQKSICTVYKVSMGLEASIVAITLGGMGGGTDECLTVGSQKKKAKISSIDCFPCVNTSISANFKLLMQCHLMQSWEKLYCSTTLCGISTGQM